MKKKGLLTLILGLVMAMLVVGCGSSKDSAGNDSSGGKKIKVGFAIKTQDSPYFVSLVKAVQENAKKEGWDVTVLDANGSTSKEAENMETFIARGMDLIFLDSVEPDAAVPSINKAAEAGIGVINLDSGVGEGAKDITTVYSDNKQNGRLVGLTYAEKMGDQDIKAIILSGAKGNVAGAERRTGLFAGIIEGRTGVSEEKAWELALAFDSELLSKGKATNAEAKFTVAGQGWGAWTEEQGLTAAEDLITANRDLTTVLGENDQMLFGAMTALGNAGIEGVDIVAAADGAKAAYDLIKEGTYFATGENSPYKVAQLGVKIAKEILVDGKDMWSYDDITLTEPAAVTKENVEEYYEFGF
ncbi:substrate-binding domain-containing protein [Paenibacillus sp. J2TS4]|uniref:substrate-binding domain-containing protein n=1 Tax=Paenibacillus sp. J2TS4 TaxID=2807194 RepID=UPI001B11A1F4|nr:substrate-binding domain-containing protein [Paenibacillus sp. J2TS4]GIP34937.1 ABC transporter substrate-binding protein [Paenibacillus sp. J2TS4]